MRKLLLLASTFAALAGVTALPADSATPVTFQLVAGTLSISAPTAGVSLGSQVSSTAPSTISGPLGVVTVSDQRGGTTTWTASVIRLHSLPRPVRPTRLATSVMRRARSLVGRRRGPGKHAVMYENVLMAFFLIIEPDEDIRRLYAAVVRGLGHEAAFFEGLPTPKPDVVLVEPADSNSLAATLRLQHDDPNLPIVCASVDKPTPEKAHGLRATTYLLKPFNLGELTNALKLALWQRSD